MISAENAYSKEEDDKHLVRCSTILCSNPPSDADASNIAKERLEQADGFRRAVMSKVRTGRELASLSVDELKAAGMAEKQAKRYRFWNTCTFCCLKNVGDPNLGNSLMKHNQSSGKTSSAWRSSTGISPTMESRRCAVSWPRSRCTGNSMVESGAAVQADL